MRGACLLLQVHYMCVELQGIAEKTIPLTPMHTSFHSRDVWHSTTGWHKQIVEQSQCGICIHQAPHIHTDHAKFAKVSRLPRLKFCIYMHSHTFRSVKPWERGYTLMAIHVYIHPLGFVPSPLETTKASRHFIFSHVTTWMLICSFDWWWIVLRAVTTSTAVEHLLKNGSMKLTMDRGVNRYTVFSILARHPHKNVMSLETLLGCLWSGSQILLLGGSGLQLR